MHGQFYDDKGDVPECRIRRVKMLGVGAGAPTQVFGAGVKAITRVSAGDYKVQWNDNPGVYLDAAVILESTAMTDLKNFSVVNKPFDAVNNILEFTIFNGAGVATDLAAAQWAMLYAEFKLTKVS